MDIGQAIGRATFFKGLAQELIEQLASIAVFKNYDSGEIIFEEGDPGLGFHLVDKGRVKIFKSSPDGREQILHLFDPGEPFGEVAIFLGRGYPAWAQALAPTRTVFFPRESLRALVARNPDLAFGLLAVLSQRLVRFASLVESITLKEVPARLAAFIINSAAGADKMELTVTKNQLASLLGATPETISRALGRLKKSGLIKEEKPFITIVDRPGLSQWAAGLADIEKEL